MLLIRFKGDLLFSHNRNSCARKGLAVLIGHVDCKRLAAQDSYRIRHAPQVNLLFVATRGGVVRQRSAQLRSDGFRDIPCGPGRII